MDFFVLLGMLLMSTVSVLRTASYFRIAVSLVAETNSDLISIGKNISYSDKIFKCWMKCTKI